MRAVILSEPGTAQLTEIPKPAVGPGEALLKIRRVGLCGSDLNSYRGRNPLVSYPRIPGHEIAATIVEMSEPHSALAAGMDVTLSPYTSCGECASCRQGRHNACQFNQTLGVQRDGALTEFVSMPVERLFPARLSLEALCLVEPLTVGFHAAARGRVAAGETAVVIGCGGAGLGAIAAAAFRGATTIAVDIDDAKLALARKAGAAHTIHSQRESLSDALRALTGGRGPDAIIEAAGTAATYGEALAKAAWAGRVVCIGYVKEPVSCETRLIVQKELDILGTRNALPEDFRQVIAMLEAGRFPAGDAISTIVRLEDTPGIFAEWSAEPSRFGKIMISLDEQSG